MQNKISNLSQKAKQLITTKLAQEQAKPDKEKLQKLLQAFIDLDSLMEVARKQNATIGLMILKHQLQKSSTELNAEILLKNYLNIINLPTTSSLLEEATELLPFLKIISLIPLMFMMTFGAVAPLLLMSPLFWIYLVVSALPLMATFCFDKPFSMSRWYHEMSNIEKILGYSMLLVGLFTLLVLATSSPPVITFGMIAIGLISVIVTSVLLIGHGQILYRKHEVLENATSSGRNLLSLFQSNNFEHHSNNVSDVIQGLRNIR
jgi:hypothetical protein